MLTALLKRDIFFIAIAVMTKYAGSSCDTNWLSKCQCTKNKAGM